jgi:hypothetical protein
MANTVSKMTSTGIMYTSGEIDELTNNITAQGSILFNTTSYLTTPASANYAFGTGDFTVECWVYITTAAASASFIGSWTGTAATSAWLFTQGTTSTNLRFGVSDGTTTTFVEGTGGLSLNKWIHIAAVRTSGNIVLYANGVSVYSGALTQNISVSSQALQINGVNGLTFMSTCYITNLRIVKGVAVYTGAFTVPTKPLQKTQSAETNIAALTNSDNTSLLLSTLYVNTNFFKDYSDNNFIITNVGTPTSSNLHPFNPDKYNSVYFNGTSTSYIYTPYNVNQTLGTNNFTIEGWIYPTNLSLQGYIISSWYGVGGQFFLRVTSAGRLQFNFTLTGDSGQSLTATTTIISANAWHHIAVVRNEATITLYVNGTADLNTFNVGSLALVYRGAVQKDIYLGKDGTTSSLFYAGYMYNMRIVNGTAVYTSNFSPPTEPLTAIANTQLLVFVNKTITEASSGLTLNNTTGVFPGQSLQPLPLSYANTGIAVSKQYNNGSLQTTGILDELSLNTNMTGSVSFNGTTQYLVFPLNEAFNLSTGDFTFEAWIMPTNATIPQWACIFGGVNFGSSSDYVFQAGSGPNVGNYPYANFTNSQADNINSSVALVPFKWQHIALTRKAGVFAMFIDGVLTGTYYNPTNSMNNTLQKGIGGGYNGNVNTLFPGYISNVRLVKGLAVYSGIWDSPNTALTTTSQNANSSQVSLLTAQSATIVDNSTGNSGSPFTITNNNTVTSGNSIIPFAGTYSYQFNGSNYLTVPNNAAFQFGTGEFTVEMWVRPTALADTGIFYKRASSAIFASIGIGTSAAGYFTIVLSDTAGTAWTINNATVATYSINTWYHIAVTKKTTLYGSHIYFYVNGSLKYRGTMNTGASVAIRDDGAAVAIGSAGSTTPSSYFTGYISNLRVVKGTALYQNQTIFTPPSRSLEVTQLASANIAAITNKSQVSLLLETTKTGYADVGANNIPITFGGSPQPSQQNPFLTNPNGYFSNFFNGTTQYLTTPSNAAFTFGTGDLSMETWIYQTATSVGAYKVIFADGVYGAAGGWTLYSYNDQLNLWKGGASAVELIAPAGSIPLNTWTHVAWTRNGSDNRLFINGTQVGATTTDSTDFTSTQVYIGASRLATLFFPGYMSNVRIVKGTAVYTSNFTPSTTPLTSISGTSLLTCQSGAIRDNSTNVFTITNTGTVTTTDLVIPFTALANTAPTITSGTTLRKQYNTGNIQVITKFDEATGTA